MKTLLRVAVVVAFLFAALTCYALGFKEGGVAIIVLGGIFELLFWIGAFNKWNWVAGIMSR